MEPITEFVKANIFLTLFPAQRDMKDGEALLQLLISFTSKYAIINVKNPV
jgi:hypothetical protein